MAGSNCMLFSNPTQYVFVDNHYITVDGNSGSPVTPGTGNAEYALFSNGTASLDGGGSGILTVTTDFGSGSILIPSEWLKYGNATLYSVRATLVSGDTPTGSALNTWLQLSTSRSWALSATSTSFASKSCVLLIEIANSLNTSIILDSANITITATGQGAA